MAGQQGMLALSPGAPRSTAGPSSAGGAGLSPSGHHGPQGASSHQSAAGAPSSGSPLCRHQEEAHGRAPPGLTGPTLLSPGQGMGCCCWGQHCPEHPQNLPAPCPGKVNHVPAHGLGHSVGSGGLPAPSLPYSLQRLLQPGHVLGVTRQHRGSHCSHPRLAAPPQPRGHPSREHTASVGEAGTGCSGCYPALQ